MFQAKANGGGTASVATTKHEFDLRQGIASQLDAAASYAISDEQKARKRFWTTGNKPH
jgi:hypothetical protein